MRATLAVSMGLVFIVATACISPTMGADSCAYSGAAVNIGAYGLTFSPSTATITQGRSVCWQNAGSVGHTVTSNDGTSFNSSLPPHRIFVHAFPTAGSFPYHCMIHAGMNGTITVN